MFQLTPPNPVQTQSIPSSNMIFLRGILQLPQAVSISVIFDFYQNIYLFTLEFIPFPLEKKVP
jgi:hypothetical protein